ncbi:TPR-like protein [Tothia fuscella]|uniref:TPR-like protein n=1 Tax=Tothia fuscella TaxID=1048955 RepID=A0A9P4NWM7_9PEZI|nr:TPR-like protein [Tothia fuscella]
MSALQHHHSPVTHHGGPPPPGHPNGMPIQKNLQQMLSQVNEATWLQIGALNELQGDLDAAITAYEQAIKHNSWSVPAMQAISCILRSRDQFGHAIDYLRTILKIDANNGEVWGSLGHCYLMLDNLQEAYSAYQQALYHLQDPKEPKLWYGIGILYDRYGSLEHAEEAFSQVMRMSPEFEKANEVYFRLGIIYKQQQKYGESLECFKYIVRDPPRPLTEEDIWFQIGHVHEQQKDFDSAKAAYRRVLDRDPKHAKVLQQLGWLHHQQSTSFANQEQAIEYLEKSVSSDQNDAQSWYLLGRCYMAQQKYPKAYEAYQQAVYRDGRNPTFWCSIGVLYYQINQYRDALDAYSRAIRLNPNISEVWYDLGTLYESCNNQTADALDAYQRAADLDPTNVHIKARLQLLQNGQPTNGMPNQNSAPLPQDIHPQAYQPAPVNGPPGPQWGAPPPNQAHQGPPPPAFDYNRRLAEIQHPQAPPQQLHPIGPDPMRDAPRPQGLPPASGPRPMSPRQEQMRGYQEPPRSNVTGPPRRLTPSPKSQHAISHPYNGGQNLPPPPPPLVQQPLGQPAQSIERRITNPNYGPQSQSISGPPPPPPTSGTPHSAHPGYGRAATPPEVRPLNFDRPSSAGSNFPPQHYAHHPNAAGPSSIASGAPPPVAALQAAEAAARDRDDRPHDRPPSTTNGPKRMREWEDEPGVALKQSSDEKRQRMDDHIVRPHSMKPDRASQASPPRPHSVDADARRREEEQRRANENYQPSAHAHHEPVIHHDQQQQHQQQQQQVPLFHQPTPTPQPQSIPRMSEAVKEERPREEPAARRMEVDEDYDDDGDDDKRPQAKLEQRESPKSAAPIAVAAGGD